MTEGERGINWQATSSFLVYVRNLAGSTAKREHHARTHSLHEFACRNGVLDIKKQSLVQLLKKVGGWWCKLQAAL